MADDFGGKNRSALWSALQKLSQGDGVQRKSLVEALDPGTGELGELQRHWKLDLSRGWKVVRYGVWSNLEECIERLVPRPARQGLSVEDRKKQYLHAVRVSFQLMGHQDLIGKDLTGRRNWLADNARGKLKISVSISQDDLNDAITQIEQQILETGYEPARVEPNPADGLYVGAGGDPSGTSGAPIGGNGDEISRVSDAQPGGKPPVDPRAAASMPGLRLLRVVLSRTGMIAGVLVLAAIFVPLGLDWSRSGASQSTTTTQAPASAQVSQPSPASAVSSTPATTSPSTGPVQVGKVSYLRDGSGPAGWSFVFPQKWQLSTADLAALNGTNGNGQGYVDWSLSKGGVTPDDARFSIDLRGNGQQSVTVRDLQVVKQCQAPLTGTLLYSPPAGPSGDVNLLFDLDKQFPVAQSYENGKAAGSYFAQAGNGHTIQLAPGESQTLLVDSTTSKQYCQYHFNLIVDTVNGTISETIDDNGKPFQVTATIDDSATMDPQFNRYQAVYGRGTANPSGDASFAQVDPATYRGY